MLDALKEVGSRLWRLLVPAGGVVLSVSFGELIGTVRDNWALFFRNEPPPWLTEEKLAPWAQPALALFILGSLLWAFWPLLLWARSWVVQRLSHRHAYGMIPVMVRSVAGGRAIDEAGRTIGPMPVDQAVALWGSDGEPEFIPLEEAARWLYDNGSPWLREHLKDPRPFESIIEHASALVGAAADDGVGELRASREPGLKPEKVTFDELKGTPFEAAFGRTRPAPVNPEFRKADLPRLLEYYQDPYWVKSEAD